MAPTFTDSVATIRVKAPNTKMRGLWNRCNKSTGFEMALQKAAKAPDVVIMLIRAKRMAVIGNPIACPTT